MPTGTSAAIVTLNLVTWGGGALGSGFSGCTGGMASAVIPLWLKSSFCGSSMSLNWKPWNAPLKVTSKVVPDLPPGGMTWERRGLGNCEIAGCAKTEVAQPSSAKVTANRRRIIRVLLISSPPWRAGGNSLRLPSYWSEDRSQRSEVRGPMSAGPPLIQGGACAGGSQVVFMVRVRGAG